MDTLYCGKSEAVRGTNTRKLANRFGVERSSFSMKSLPGLRRSLVAVVVALLLSGKCDGQNYALLFGNSEYTHGIDLPNAVNDVDDLGAALKGAGWNVTVAKNVGIREMHRSVRLFTEKIAEAEAAMVFFAGHGIEVKGENYLLPSDAQLLDEEGEDALPFETLALDTLLDDLGESGVRLKVVVLDCCRNNPLSRSWLRTRSQGSGLASVSEEQMPDGAMLVFSTAPGFTASDGVGRNSPFTSALLDRISSGGGSIGEVFGDVARALGREQPAWFRFDGRGTSFSEFQQYPLVPGFSPNIPGDSETVVALREEIQTLKAKIEEGRADSLEVIGLRSRILELEREVVATQAGAMDQSQPSGQPIVSDSAINSASQRTLISVGGIEMSVNSAVQSTSDITINVEVRNTTASPLVLYASNPDPYTYRDFRDDLSQWQALGGSLTGDNGDRFRLLGVTGMEYVDRANDPTVLFRDQNYLIKLAPGDTAPLILHYGARGTDQFTQSRPVHEVTGVLEARVVSSSSRKVVATRGFGFSNLTLDNR
ncbi:MAG: caspase family protein [Verrucomicrobiota bacterium]